VGRPSAPVEEERSSLRTDTAGSDALVFAELVARRFYVRSRPVEGLLVPRAACSGLRVGSACRKFSFGRACGGFEVPRRRW